MLFNSTAFGIFLIIALLLFWSSPRSRRVYLLVGLSYFFYMYWNPVFILLIIASTVLDYYCGLGFLKWPKDKHKWLVTFSVCGNLGILAFFKYGRFFYQNARAIGASLGAELPPFPEGLDFVLPVGISFYTFQTLSYTIDLD